MGGEYYPHGRIQIEGVGDMLDVTTIKHDVSNQGKLVHTLGSTGWTTGNNEHDITFDVAIPATGFTMDFIECVVRHLSKEVRVKIPGKTIQCFGIFTAVSTDMPIDDAVKQGVSFIGVSRQ
jgi:hypothetical protein